MAQCFLNLPDHCSSRRHLWWSGGLFLLTAILAGCGGTTPGAPEPTGSDSDTTPVAAPAPTLNCYSASVANVVGPDDFFSVNAWHLKNLGPTQVVSAVSNNGLMGIDANVEPVHKAGLGCTGKGVTIAIVDSGLELAHEDLADNVLPGKSWNFGNNTNDSSPAPNQAGSDHGTGVAGVAAARGWNGKGSRGTAPFASMVGFSMPDATTPPPGVTEQLIEYLSFGARTLADTKNTVVGLFGDRADQVSIFNFSIGTDYAAPAVVDEFRSSHLATAWGTQHLRNGLGAIYLQSAGNEQLSMDKGVLPDGTQLSVNCSQVLKADSALLGGVISNSTALTCGSSNHEPAGKPYLYQVASIASSGRASSYSSSAAANWMTGFGGEFGTTEPAIISTDNSGCQSGANNVNRKTVLEAYVGEFLFKLIADLFGTPGSKDVNCNYTGTMNGTSAAAPSVSGVTALMLEANPQLTWQDVGYIFAKTARKVDAEIASGSRAVTFTPNGGEPWNLDDPWVRNAAGFNFQNQYGFGLVDADAAVRMAIAFKTPEGRRPNALTVKGAASTATTKGNVGVNVSTVNFPVLGTSGQMRLDLTVTNNTGVDINPGMLQFEIVNKTTGTKSIVLPAFTAWYVGGKNFKIKPAGQQPFRFHTNAFYGESMAGDYVVSVLDFSGSSGDSGKRLAFEPSLTSFSM
jgi:subtilisin family serine protease